MINDFIRNAAASETAGIITFLFAWKYPLIQEPSAAAGSDRASILTAVMHSGFFMIFVLIGRAVINTITAEVILRIREKVKEYLNIF